MNMKKVKLEESDNISDYSQIYQEVNVKFSFLKRGDGKNTFRELFPQVLCRDYLSDCVAASILGETIIYGIYGFELNEGIEISELLMSVDVKSKKHFERGLAVIRNLEKEFKNIKKGLKVYKTDIGNRYVIEADKVWLTNSLTISLFTFLIRCINHNTPYFRKFENLFKHIVENEEGNDTSYIKQISNINIRTLLSNIDEVVKDHPAIGYELGELNDGSVFNLKEESNWILECFHNNSGIVGLSNNIKKLSNNKYESFIGRSWAVNYYKISEEEGGEVPSYMGYNAGDKIKSEDGSDIFILRIENNYLAYYFDKTRLYSIYNNEYEIIDGVLIE